MLGTIFYSVHSVFGINCNEVVEKGIVVVVVVVVVVFFFGCCFCFVFLVTTFLLALKVIKIKLCIQFLTCKFSVYTVFFLLKKSELLEILHFYILSLRVPIDCKRSIRNISLPYLQCLRP